MNDIMEQDFSRASRTLFQPLSNADHILKDASIHQLFQAQVERTPDAVALMHGEALLTYRELDQQSTRLAQQLGRMGVKPEVLVGLCLERSLSMIVGVLAVFKAGGAYVPLDPLYPQARLSWMLRDSQASLLLTQQSLQEKLVDAHLQTPLLYVQADQPVLPQEDEITRIASPVTDHTLAAENLAYVIYTSGSTGTPKGVAITHRSAVAMLHWAGELFGPVQRRSVLASTSLCFDLSVFEIWLPLCHGGQVILVDNALQLPSLPAAEYVSLLNTVPSVMTELLRTGALPRSIKTVNLAGEPLPAHLAQQLYALESIEQLYNLYGPSEDTTYSTWALVERQPGKSVPIGRPITGSQAYVLDTALQPVAVDMPGELYLGGAGLARGYLGRPDLTAERFIPNPFSGEPGTRMYGTGDIVRLRSDDSLEFVGRRDEQIKIRGFRVETGEIDAVLHEHALVWQAVTILREDRPGDKRLVAYVETARDHALTTRDLRSWLETRLPDYMLPSAFVLMEHLPLTPNGKIDRQALPAPEESREALEVEFVPPRNALEETLVGIWCQVLGRKQIGIDDNFFALGGHSLLATQIITRVRTQLQTELPLLCLFEAPTVAELADLFTKVHGREQELEPMLLQPSTSNEPAPLSFPQERIWFIQQLHTDARAYHFQATLRLRGTLDFKALEKSLNEIIRRHEIMRTTFPAHEGKPVQRVHPSYEVSLPLLDLADLPIEAQTLEERLLVDEAFHQTFDLTQLPLLRWVLLRLNAEEHVLVHIEHHLIHDGWSFNVFLRELFELYRAFSADRPSPLPELPVQFSDFVRWQRLWMQGAKAEAQFAYWRDKLAAGTSTLQLPTDRPRPAVQSLRGAALRIELPVDLCEDMRVMSRREGTTLFMTMLSIFFTLLWRYSGQDDISVGTGIANRRWREAEGLIGMLINTLVLRDHLSGEQTFRQLLHNVREICLAAYAHQDLPFERVVEAVQPERNLSHNPLFQVVFAFHDSPLPALTLPGLEVELLEALNNGSAKFDLNVTVIPRSEQRMGQDVASSQPGGITMIWEYSTDLFEETTIARMVEHYQTLARHAVADAGRQIGELSLLPPAELALLSSWNPPVQPFQAPLGVHNLFTQQAQRTPDAIAVSWNDQQLTYQQLDLLSSRVALHLRSLALPSEALVAILLERSPLLLIALLASLKAGAAYLPLSPALPTTRLLSLLDQAHPHVLLSQHALLSSLSDDLSLLVPALALDTLLSDLPLSADPPLPGAIPFHAEQLAYVIFTSGSTGAPKGVMLSHRNLLHLIDWHQHAFTLTPSDHISQVADLSFDAMGWELWPCLLSGARLCLPADPSFVLPPLLQRWMQQEALTLCFLPTPLAELVLRQPDTLSTVTSLRFLLTGGDRLHALPLDALSCQLINNYGPTETTVVATSGSVSSSLAASDPAPDIGSALTRMRAYVLDEQMQQVPIGVPGELYLGGTGLARGYLQRPDLTAERFLPHPFSEQPGARLYRSGDFVRWRVDGTLDFVGRRDEQVKIRGFRVELAEIAAVLQAHPAVQQAVVLPAYKSQEETNDTRLIAYVVPLTSQSGLEQALREWMTRRLPGYMIPGDLIVLSDLPLTAQGKLDRRALPMPVTPSWEAPSSGESATPLEQILSEIWQETLGRSVVGIHDNFFSLGGHSLLFTQVAARVHDTFQIELPLRSMFEKPTVSEQAFLLLHNSEESARIEKTAQLLLMLAQMSDDEVDEMSQDSLYSSQEG